MAMWNFPAPGGYMEAPRRLYYQTMTKKDIEERLLENDVLLVPVGSTENHGNAGPSARIPSS
jgi:creatinine amidohydrolase